jgi:hypothetical protein
MTLQKHHHYREVRLCHSATVEYLLIHRTSVPILTHDFTSSGPFWKKLKPTDYMDILEAGISDQSSQDRSSLLLFCQQSLWTSAAFLYEFVMAAFVLSRQM